MNENLLSAISGLIDNAKYCDDKGVQQEILLLAQKHLNAIVGGFTRPIECVKSIYENDGFIAAIKEWRAITGKGLKEAKEDVEKAADTGRWKYFLIGKTMRITSTNDYVHGELCVVIKATRGNNECTVILNKDGFEWRLLTNQLTEVR